MDRIRVNTEALAECANAISRGGSEALDISAEVQAILASLPESCEKYERHIRIYQRELRAIGEDLNDLGRDVRRAGEDFARCEESLKSGHMSLSTGDAEEASSKKSIWKTWPLSWIDAALDWLGIDKYGRDYEDPGMEREQARNDLIRSEVENMVGRKYPKIMWDHATLEEKEKMLNDFMHDLNRIYGINISKDVEFYRDEPNSLGFYRDSERRVFINENAIEQWGYEEMMNTVVHEMRHAYQHEAVRNPGRFEVSEETVRSWEGNFGPNYIDPDDDWNAYRHQPVEEDAHDIADNIDYNKFDDYWEQQYNPQNFR